MGYQVPKLTIDVRIFLTDGIEMEGSLFITENLVSHTGTPRLEDFLNQNNQRFFPFHQKDGETLLIGKHRLVYLRSSEKDADVLEDQLMIEPRAVTVHMAYGHNLEGAVYAVLPKEANRVSDFFNQKETFLSLYQEEDKVILNTDMIVWVRDDSRQSDP